MLAAPMIAMMYAAQKWVNLSFAPFDLFDWIARLLPGPVVTFGIDRMVDALLLFGASVSGTAKTAEQSMAVGLFFVGVVVATIIVFAYIDRLGHWRVGRAWPAGRRYPRRSRRPCHRVYRAVLPSSRRQLPVGIAAVHHLGQCGGEIRAQTSSPHSPRKYRKKKAKCRRNAPSRS